MNIFGVFCFDVVNGRGLYLLVLTQEGEPAEIGCGLYLLVLTQEGEPAEIMKAEIIAVGSELLTPDRDRKSVV